MTARLWVRPMEPRRGEWDGRDEQVRGLLANKELVTYIAEAYGGMFGDWRDAGMIPELEPLDLADLPVTEWRMWLHMMRTEVPIT